ncbi:MAG: hypothetical protein M0T74_03500 [Desulfitobacterium hafniense]|nr:hypothetical protein [Desulfitobacterium hafniense]
MPIIFKKIYTWLNIVLLALLFFVLLFKIIVLSPVYEKNPKVPASIASLEFMEDLSGR